MIAKVAAASLLILGCLVSAQSICAQEQPKTTTIERIDIRGNRRIPEDTIRFYIQCRTGDVYDEGRIELDLRALAKANFFESIEVDGRDSDTGKIVTFMVKEKPLVRDIIYEGNKSFTESNILDQFKTRKVGLTKDSQYDPSKIRAAERALKDLMTQNGKPLGTVHSEIENVPPSSVRVRFIMEEGAKVRIGQIRFVGNKIYSDGELKSMLKLTKERGMKSMFKGTDKFHREKLEYDLETNLRKFYREHGYMQVQIGDPMPRIYEGSRGMVPMMRKTKQQFYVEIPIEAGDQFRLGKFEIKDCKIMKVDFLLKSFGLNPGDVVNFKKVQDTLEQIKKAYGNLGYINMSYLPEQKFDEKNKTVDMTFTFVEDKQFLVNRIIFAGNTKTRDKVVRREFVLEEGNVFSSYLLDTSILKVNQLGFFDRIEEKDYSVKPDDKTGKVDVEVKLKEKSQQSIGLTGGVSGISGSFLGINYVTNNFMGKGETLEVSISGGTRTTDYILSFTEPYFLDTRTTLGVSLFNQRFRFDTFSAFGVTNFSTGKPTELFTRRTTGATITLSRPLGHSWWRMGGSYSYQKIGIGRIATGYETYALGQLVGFVPGGTANARLDGFIRSEVTPTFSRNTTNHYFNPTRGSSVTFSLGISGGVLGGDFRMIRPALEYRKFYPDKWISHGRNTLGFRILAEYIQSYGNSSIPFFDRFFIGGETTIRGFDIRSISPMAVSSTPLYDRLGSPIIDQNNGLAKINRSLISAGGDTLGIFNGEYRIPIVGPLSMSAFYDLGLSRISRRQGLGSFGTSSIDLIPTTNSVVRGSAGVEIQFLLPVVSAPFRLIFALNPQSLDSIIMIGATPVHLREPRHDIKFTIGRSF